MTIPLAPPLPTGI